MKGIRAVLILVCTIPCLLSAARIRASQTARGGPPRRSSMVVLSVDGAGDFGPGTPGTRTAGWQEALDYCVAHKRDLYVEGGYGGRQVYNVQETIHVPPAQDFRIDGGVYVINWTGSPDQDLMRVDSTMNCEYHLGIMVYGGKAIALHVRPEHPVPIDNFPICVETKLEMEGLADPSPFAHGERRAGEGFVLDGTKASIVHSEFRLASVINFHTCMRTVGGVGYNRIVCPHLHSNADRGTLFVSDDGLAANTLAFTIGVDQGADGVTGVILSGRKNSVELAQRESDRPFAAGRSLVLNGSAEGNQINLICPPIADPASMITDDALHPTNQVTWAGDAPAIRTVHASAGAFTYTQRLWPAGVLVEGGKIRRLVVSRGGRRVSRNPKSPGEIQMSVGDTLTIQSGSPIRLTVVPLKVR